MEMTYTGLRIIIEKILKEENIKVSAIDLSQHQISGEKSTYVLERIFYLTTVESGNSKGSLEDWEELFCSSTYSILTVLDCIFKNYPFQRRELYKKVYLLLATTQNVSEGKVSGYRFDRERLVSNHNRLVHINSIIFLNFINEVLLKDLSLKNIYEIIIQNNFELKRYEYFPPLELDIETTKVDSYAIFVKLLSKYLKEITDHITSHITLYGRSILTSNWENCSLATIYYSLVKNNFPKSQLKKDMTYYWEGNNDELERIFKYLFKENKKSKYTWLSKKNTRSGAGTDFCAFLSALNNCNKFNYRIHETQDLYDIITNTINVPFKFSSITNYQIDNANNAKVQYYENIIEKALLKI